MNEVIYLVRHAHSDWSPDEQRPLSAKGHADAVLVADVLAQHPIQAIYSSPYARARQTVEPLAARLRLTIIEHPDLRERQISAKPVEDFLVAVTMLWKNPKFAFVGGESNVQAQERGVTLIKELLKYHGGESIVVATHGNLLALILQHFDPAVDFDFWQQMTMPDVYALDVQMPKGENMMRLWKENL
jgi:2,3-bisphosphoglycerate-dependent phosphoglycerate mutase